MNWEMDEESQKRNVMFVCVGVSDQLCFSIYHGCNIKETAAGKVRRLPTAPVFEKTQEKRRGGRRNAKGEEHTLWM